MCLSSYFLRISCLISTCFLSIYSVAQTPTINFRHIKSENGLSNSTIETILQDNRGFLWFGTRDGLNRYDGSQMIVYRNSSTDSSSISDNYITSLYEDKQHSLWVGTINGLNIFDPKLNRFMRLKQKRDDAKSISHNHISVI